MNVLAPSASPPEEREDQQHEQEREHDTNRAGRRRLSVPSAVQAEGVEHNELSRTSSAKSRKPAAPSETSTATDEVEDEVGRGDEISDEDDEREATELRAVVASEPRRRQQPSAPIAGTLSHAFAAAEASSGRQNARKGKWHGPVSRFWRRHIRISVPHVDCRDHLANERTFLSYLRSSAAFSMLGTVIAQLYQLEHSQDPNKVFGYYVLGRPLAIVFQVMALLVVLAGGVRFWRQQDAMARGKVMARGWEIVSVGLGTLLVLVMMVCVHVGVIIYKSVGN